MRALTSSTPYPSTRAQAGFTLVEVILAIGITIGMLLAILFFYNQVLHLRESILEESEGTAAARLILDRLSAELRAARPHEVLWLSLNGSSNSIEFISTSLPAPASWAEDDLGRARRPESDLKLLRYTLSGADNPSEATGVARSEVSVLETDFYLPEEEIMGEGEVNLAASIPNPTPEMLTEHLRYLRFRYWDGTTWQDTWAQIDLPVGVEVSLGRDPIPEELSEEEVTFEYPFELFRRIIYLPGSKPVETASSFQELLSAPVGPEEIP